MTSDFWRFASCPMSQETKRGIKLHMVFDLAWTFSSLHPLPPHLSFLLLKPSISKIPCKKNAKIFLMSYPCNWLYKVKGTCTLYLSQANYSEQCQCERTNLNLTLISFLVGCKTCSMYEVLHNYRRLWPYSEELRQKDPE